MENLRLLSATNDLCHVEHRSLEHPSETDYGHDTHLGAPVKAKLLHDFRRCSAVAVGRRLDRHWLATPVPFGKLAPQFP